MRYHQYIRHELEEHQMSIVLMFLFLPTGVDGAEDFIPSSKNIYRYRSTQIWKAQSYLWFVPLPVTVGKQEHHYFRRMHINCNQEPSPFVWGLGK